MIDINNFDAIRIGLASSQADPRLVVGRGHQARDDQLPHAQAREGRPLLRAHLRSDEGLGVLLRQVQARPLQGHHLRALRRRGDAPEGAARAHGSHRPGRARLAHLVLQGRPEPHRLPARHRPEGAREGPLLRRLDRHAGRRWRSGRPTSPTSRTRCAASTSASTSTATRRSPRSRSGSRAGATTSRRARSRTSTRTTSSGSAACPPGPRSRACRPSRRRARSSSGIFIEVAQTVTTEDSKKIRELVRSTADPRRPPAGSARARGRRQCRGPDPATRSRRSRSRPTRRPARRRARSRST